jgi:eukaryotic-like serine/threonine-protein kinase
MALRGQSQTNTVLARRSETGMVADRAETLPQDALSRQQSQELSLSVSHPGTVPGYQLVKRLGAGGYGTVWLARELNTGKQVAIKFYSQPRGVDWSLLGREVEKLAVLSNSRYIVRLLAVGWDHDPPYYVMEYLEHGSLAARLEQGPVAVGEAVRLIKQIAMALVHAHGSGILHCDLKPGNVLLDRDFEPRLCDFGQSRLVHERQPALGTLFYMAPEQADIKSLPDARWDVYALGALLYHLLCGAPPYRSTTIEAAVEQQQGLSEQLAAYRQGLLTAPRPSAHRQVAGVDPVLAEVVDRCLAVDPKTRFPNAQAVLDRLHLRERQRARRPLLLTGFLLPVLLILALLPMALVALRTAVTTSRSTVIARALESDALSVHLLANSLRRELEDRLTELQIIANDPQVRSVLRDHLKLPLEQRQPMAELLSARKQAVDQRRSELQRTRDASWFLQDRDGYQRWREPYTAGSMDRQYHYRDYFHGHGVEYAPESVPQTVHPVELPHVSIAYRSTSTEQWVLALSVPVWEPEVEGGPPSKVMAVLARSLEVSQLLGDYKRSLTIQGDSAVGPDAGESAAIGRQLALVDSRSWNLLAHPLLTNENLEKWGVTIDGFHLDDALIGRLSQAVQRVSEEKDWLQAIRQGSELVESYRDPVAQYAPQEYGGEWLAAFAPVGQTGWIAVVQERRLPVLAPIEQLRDRLLAMGWTGFAVVTVLVLGCWGWIIMVINERRPRWWYALRERLWGATATPATLRSFRGDSQQAMRSASPSADGLAVTETFTADRSKSD